MYSILLLLLGARVPSVSFKNAGGMPRDKGKKIIEGPIHG